MESIYIELFHIFVLNAIRYSILIIITLKDQESHPCLILSQLPRNNDNNVNNYNSPRKHYNPAAC